MDNKDFFKRAGFSAIVVALAGVTAFAVPTNGDFSDGLNGWTIESGTVFDGGGFALFIEDFSVPSSTLSQEFTIPLLALELSFDVNMESDLPESPVDVFTAYLYDNSTDLKPLVSNPGVGVDEFFYMDNDGVINTVGTFDGTTVTLDVSGFRGLNAYLVFDLWNGDDKRQTGVSLDNVSISVVPAPGALMLGLIGTGMVGVIRKLRVGKLI